jgi:hypothetical protein
MTTRCQINFKVKYGNEEQQSTIYQHSDGYPDGVLPDLKEFFKWLSSSPHPRNPAQLEYTTANFIYWSKKKLESYKNGTEKLGYGICSSDILHGDIAYFYEVEITPTDTNDFNPKNDIMINVYHMDHQEKTLLKTVNLAEFTEWKN